MGILKNIKSKLAEDRKRSIVIKKREKEIKIKAQDAFLKEKEKQSISFAQKKAQLQSQKKFESLKFRKEILPKAVRGLAKKVASKTKGASKKVNFKNLIGKKRTTRRKKRKSTVRVKKSKSGFEFDII